MAIALLPPTPDRGTALHRLVCDCPPLDANSPYAYHLICRHHAETSLLALDDQTLAGAITAYRLPADPAVLFIWQIAVHPSHRGLGLARRLLEALVARQIDEGVRNLQTTIGPGNAASRRLFGSFAERRRLPVRYQPFLEAADCGHGHDAEELLLLGPLTSPIIIGA